MQSLTKWPDDRQFVRRFFDFVMFVRHELKLWGGMEGCFSVLHIGQFGDESEVLAMYEATGLLDGCFLLANGMDPLDGAVRDSDACTRALINSNSSL